MIFEEKSQNGANWKSGHRAPTPQRREPKPRRSPTPQRGMPSSRRGQGTKMEPPQVRYGVALLSRGVDTVHRE